MGVNPAQNQQIILDAVIQQRGLVLCLARIRRAFLFRDHQSADEQRVVNRRPAQDAAHLETPPRVVRCDGEEAVAHRCREEDRTYGFAVFEVRGWSEGYALLLVLSWHGGTFVGDFGWWGWLVFCCWDRGQRSALWPNLFRWKLGW